jgi:hypothetical protein
MEYYGNCNLPPREAYVFLTGQQAVVKTNIGCKRMYLEETERDGAQLAGPFRSVRSSWISNVASVASGGHASEFREH